MKGSHRKPPLIGKKIAEIVVSCYTRHHKYLPVKRALYAICDF